MVDCHSGAQTRKDIKGARVVHERGSGTAAQALLKKIDWPCHLSVVNLERVHVDNPLQDTEAQVAERDASGLVRIDGIGPGSRFLGPAHRRKLPSEFAKVAFHNMFEPRHTDGAILDVDAQIACDVAEMRGVEGQGVVEHERFPQPHGMPRIG